MNTVNDAIRRLDGHGRPQLASFAAACATRLSPLFAGFAQSAEGRFDEWLRELWDLVSSPDRASGSDLPKRIISAPESFVDDSNRPDYYAMRVLGVLHHAAEVLRDEDPLAAAARCARAGVSTLRDFDCILKADSKSAPLAPMEVLAEHAWIDGLEAGREALLDERGFQVARAADVFRRMQEVPLQVARAREWDLDAWQEP
jgi:hypothetical protein